MAWTNPIRASVHNLLVDAYAMQHTEEYGLSAKSYAAHLIGLCCGIEASGEPDLYWAIPRWLDGPARLPRPDDLPARGEATILDVRDGATATDYPERVREWARDVWNAYAALHETARQALAAVREDMLRSRSTRTR